jgi:hypothetical protein
MVNFGDERRGAWGFGTVGFRKCDDWNNPSDCSTEANNTNLPQRGWIKCALGSSPGGVEPGNTATVCSPLSLENSCTSGQNCYLVTDTSKVRGFPTSFKFMIFMYVFLAIAFFGLSGYVFFNRNARKDIVAGLKKCRETAQKCVKKV